MARHPAPGRTRYLGIVVPVHDEEELLAGALAALETAVDRVPHHIRCQIVVVYDACQDRSRLVASAWKQGAVRRSVDRLVTEIDITAGNVGSARRAGCAAVLSAAARAGLSPGSTWLATTDADSRVPADWLCAQIARHEAGADAWSGTVTVRDWTHWTDGTATEWLRRYEAEADPVHGASLGLNGQVYVDAGEFPQLISGEDRALLSAAAALGARCHFDRSVPVSTSARRQARAPHGFASALHKVEELVRPSDGLSMLEDLSA